MDLTGNITLGMDLGACIKDASLLVHFQNALCKKICGDRVGTVCRDGCMRGYSPAAELIGGEGMEVVPSVSLPDGAVHDVVIVNDGERVTTLLYPLKRKHARQLTKLRDMGLSKRELEIMELVLMRVSNGAIAEKLCISKSTVRTHLNNIYRKLPEPWQRQMTQKRSVAPAPAEPDH